MIALLLAAQLGVVLPPGAVAGATPEPSFVYVAGERREIIQRLQPSGSCPGAGRMEASAGEPTALYRSGDRPARMMKRWVDYPAPKGCLVEAKP
jgi:hypothetical protein